MQCEQERRWGEARKVILKCPVRCRHRVHPVGEPDSDKCRYYKEQKCVNIDKHRMDNLTPELKAFVKSIKQSLERKVSDL